MFILHNCFIGRTVAFYFHLIGYFYLFQFVTQHRLVYPLDCIGFLVILIFFQLYTYHTLILLYIFWLLLVH